MMEDRLSDQASVTASLLSRLVRCFFIVDEDDPAKEFPVAQIRVCSILRDGPRSMSSLSSELGISLSAITQIADRLERQGMVERVPDAQDRRVKSLRLTSLGMATMEKRRKRRAELISRALEQLPPTSRDEVISALKTLLDAALKAQSSERGEHQ